MASAYAEPVTGGNPAELTGDALVRLQAVLARLGRVVVRAVQLGGCHPRRDENEGDGEDEPLHARPSGTASIAF